MANLFWKTRTETKRLLSTPFRSEEQFEATVFSNAELLEDIFLLKRQVRGGGKSTIPDIIGVDSDGNVCIVEMKNTTVDASIIPQVLQYAFWAETNPDSIKSLWLEAENKPDDIDISWDGFEVRILVIAPSILRSALDLVDKINYAVDQIEVQRWVEADNELLLVSKLEQEPRARPRPATGLRTYDADFYRANYNRRSADEFLKYVKQVEKVIQRREWPLETKFNKHYCSFKAGFFNAFGIQWVGSKTFAFFFKVSPEDADEIGIPLTRYETQWKQAIYYIEPESTMTDDFIPLFERAYENVAGKE